MTPALPWTVKVMHRSAETQLVDARGCVIGTIYTKAEAEAIVRAVNAAAQAKYPPQRGS